MRHIELLRTAPPSDHWVIGGVHVQKPKPLGVFLHEESWLSEPDVLPEFIRAIQSWRKKEYISEDVFTLLEQYLDAVVNTKLDMIPNSQELGWLVDTVERITTGLAKMFELTLVDDKPALTVNGHYLTYLQGFTSDTSVLNYYAHPNHTARTIETLVFPTRMNADDWHIYHNRVLNVLNIEYPIGLQTVVNHVFCVNTHDNVNTRPWGTLFRWLSI